MRSIAFTKTTVGYETLRSLHQMLVRECALYGRSRSDARLELLQGGPAIDVEREKPLPVDDREEIRVGDRERVAGQVRLGAERIDDVVEARADRREDGRLVHVGRRRLPQRAKALVDL